MTYDEAFEESKMFIRNYKRLIYASEWYNLVEPKEFEHLCMIKFYMCLKQRYDPYTALKCSKKAYRQLLSNFMVKEIHRRKIFKRYCLYIEPKDVICGLPTQQYIPYEQMGLNDNEIIICKRLLMGYKPHEIDEFTRSRWKTLRKKLIEFYHIPVNKRGEVHYVTRTETERLKKLWDSKKGKKLDNCLIVTSKPVQMIDVDGNVIKEFKSAAEASRAVGRSNCGVARAISNHNKCGGYHWKYVEKEE